MASRELSILVTAKNLATPALSAVRGELKGIEGQAARSGAAANMFASRGLGGLKNAASGVAGAFGHLKGRMGELAGTAGIVGLGAGVFSLGKLFGDSVAEVRDFGETVDRVSSITGLSVETASKLASALRYVGVGGEETIKVLGMAEKNLGIMGATAKGTATFTREYGLSVRTSNGALVDANELLLRSADYFNNKQIPAATKAAGLAKLFGRNWQSLVEVFELGRDKIAAAEEQAAKLGMTLTSGNMASILKLRDETRDWTTALGGLKLQIGLAAVPALSDLTKAATNFLANGGREQIVGFFKQLIAFGRQAADVIVHQVVPTFQAIYGAWLKVPKELRDLIITGLVANKTVKFLFGFSPMSLVTGGLGSLLKGTLGQVFQRGSPANPMFVVDVGGKGIGGGPGGGLLGAGGGKLAMLGKLLGLAGAGFAGFQIGSAIGNQIIEPTVKPARDYETGQVNRVAVSGNAAQLEKALAAVNQARDFGANFWDAQHFGALLLDAGGIRSTLDKQAATLEAQLAEARKNAPGSPASNAHIKGAAAQSAAQNAATTLTQTLKNLGFTPNMGPKERTSLLEQGTRTGTDLYGEQALAVFRQAANPKAPAVLGEISRHITELRSIEKYYLDKGNTDAAAHAQRTIEAMERLIGVTSRDDVAARQAIAAATAKHVAAVQAASRASAGARARATAQMVAAGLTGSLAGSRSTVAGIAPHLRNIEGADRSTAAFTGIISRKNFSPRVNVNVNAQVALSVNSVARSLTDMHISSGQAGGPGGFIQ